MVDRIRNVYAFCWTIVPSPSPKCSSLCMQCIIMTPSVTMYTPYVSMIFKTLPNWSPTHGASRSGPLGVIHWGYNTEYRCAKQRENISHPPSDGYGVASLHDNDTDAPEVGSEAFRSLLNNQQADRNGALDYLLD